MSINTLLDNPASQRKPWCNLYVDSLTTYQNLNVNGELQSGNLHAAELNADSLNVTNDLIVLGNSYLENTNIDGDLTVTGTITSSSIPFYQVYSPQYMVSFGGVDDTLRYPTFVKIGRSVSVWVNEYNYLDPPGTGGTGYFELSPVDPIPPELLPIDSFSIPILVQTGATSQIGNCTFDHTNGEMQIYATPDSDGFDNDAQAFFRDIMVTYVTN